MKYENKQEYMGHTPKNIQSIGAVPGKAHTWDLKHKYFKLAILNVFKELKEISTKKTREKHPE